MGLRGFMAAAIVLLVLTAGAGAQADDAAARLAAAQEMMVAGQREQLEAVRIDLLVERAVAQMKIVNPAGGDAGAERYGAILREELARDVAQLTQLRAQYYADHFTLAELKEWTRLLQSGVGRKIVAAEPEMMRDLYNVDSQWVANAMQRAAARYGQAQQDGAKPL